MKTITFNMVLLDAAGLWWPRIGKKAVFLIRKDERVWVGKINQKGWALSSPEPAEGRTEDTNGLPHLHPHPHPRLLDLNRHSQPGACPMPNASEVRWSGTIMQTPPEVSRPRHSREEKQQLLAMPCCWGQQDSTQCYLWPNQEPRCWVVGHHYGERVQDGEMEERGGRTVHGLRREADLKRQRWWRACLGSVNERKLTETSYHPGPETRLSWPIPASTESINC